MESYCSPLQLQGNCSPFLFDCDALLEKSYDPIASDPASDPGYFSAGSCSLSPTSSVDSFCFSPTSLPVTGLEQDKSRSRYPGKKRQTASEREKLRMRDLTKALHHLRMYLPPSVAPAGQTLTKIETLRLTIRYISYLSAQLGLSEEVLEQRRSAGFVDVNASVSNSLSVFCCQVSGGICFSSQQYWTPQQQLQHAAFSGQC
uniref:Mesoderm posterior ab n=1 Tax=Myripristis murdjan TaxID=586833 RepID=A0A667X0C2_9TELE